MLLRVLYLNDGKFQVGSTQPCGLLQEMAASSSLRSRAAPLLHLLRAIRCGMGHVNCEPTPGSGEPKQTVMTMLLEMSGGEAFWRLADGRTLKSEVLARWVIDRLPSFHDEYGRAVSAIGF